MERVLSQLDDRVARIIAAAVVYPPGPAEEPVPRERLGPLGPAHPVFTGIIGPVTETRCNMATSTRPRVFCIRVDAAIAEDSSGRSRVDPARDPGRARRSPGTRLPSTRALAHDLGVSRTTTLLAVQQLEAEGYLTGRRGSGTFVAKELPDDLVRRRPPGPRPPTRLTHPTVSRRGAALVAAPPGAQRLPGPPRAVPHRHARGRPVPRRALVAARDAAAAVDDAGAADYGEPAGLRALREAIAEYLTGSRRVLRRRSGLDRAGSQQGLDLIAACCSTPAIGCGWRIRATLARAARSSAPAPDPARAGRRRGPRRRWARGGRPTRGWCT